ncbi:RING finger protein 215 [Megalops cyprinoides]|uniref:RING finger protein 215 n=1 Tax=Megalops cyprinoides TaxID=118141 RepID=UPI001863AFE8|nr:RING finger protein 215 [Megalops cyprinoides]
MAVDGWWCYISVMSVLLAPSFWSCLVVSGEKVARIEVFRRERQGVSSVLQGEVVEGSWDTKSQEDRDDKDNELHHGAVEGSLRLVQDDELDLQVKSEDNEPWIGVVPVKMEESELPNGNQESFAAAVVNKMKRALVLGASALIILALNQNTVREMDLSQVLSKPVIVIQTSENVTKLIGALLRGLHATARITYKTILQDNLGATLTLWSSCGRSRGGLYGEWQGVICTGETNSQVQKYLQQLWNTVLLVALILCTGVIVQARWQYRDRQLNDDIELLPKQDILKRLAALKTRKYQSPKACSDPGLAGEADNCAVCLEQFYNNQCLRVLPCLHEFHRDCVDPWLLLQQTCPLCKRSILANLCKDS